jgi:hypothetical protein
MLIISILSYAMAVAAKNPIFSLARRRVCGIFITSLVKIVLGGTAALLATR